MFLHLHHYSSLPRTWLTLYRLTRFSLSDGSWLFPDTGVEPATPLQTGRFSAAVLWKDLGHKTPYFPPLYHLDHPGHDSPMTFPPLLSLSHKTVNPPPLSCWSGFPRYANDFSAVFFPTWYTAKLNQTLLSQNTRPGLSALPNRKGITKTQVWKYLVPSSFWFRRCNYERHARDSAPPSSYSASTWQ